MTVDCRVRIKGELDEKKWMIFLLLKGELERGKYFDFE